MRAIMISVKPEWCRKILNGEKTIELRTTCPKEWKKFLSGKTNVRPEHTKGYIYCTKPRQWLKDSPFTVFSPEQLWWQDGKLYNGKEDSLWNPKFEKPCFLNGKVVAEFTLKQIDLIEICDPLIFRNGEHQDWYWFKRNACLDSEEIMSYIGYGCDYDGWASAEYSKGYAWHIDGLKIYDKPKELNEFSTTLHRMKGKQSRYTSHLLQRSPQSWCYVEELEAK